MSGSRRELTLLSTRFWHESVALSSVVPPLNSQELPAGSRIIHSGHDFVVVEVDEEAVEECIRALMQQTVEELKK